MPEATGLAKNLGIIQRLAGPLRGYLELKAGGMDPQTLLTELRPVLDIMPFYLGNDSNFATDSVAPNAVGAILPVSLLVTPGTGNINEYYSARTATLTAGQSIRYRLIVVYPGGSVQVVSDDTSCGVGEQASVGRFNNGNLPLVLPPGAQLGVQVDGIAAGPITISLFAKGTSAKL